MSNKVKNIFFLFGLTMVILMFITFDVSLRQLWEHICHAGYWLAAAIALWGVLYALNSLSWRAILKGSGRLGISWPTLLKFTISGYALNYTTPFGMPGGEAYRAMTLSKYVGVQRATSSVVLYMMMHIFSHFWFWVTAIITYIICALCGDLSLGTAMRWVLFFASLFCAGGIYLFIRGYRYGLVTKLMRGISKIPGLRKWGTGFYAAHQDDLKKIDEQIAALHSQNRRSFFTSLGLEYGARILQSFEIFFMLLLFGVEPGVTQGMGGTTMNVGGYFLLFVHSFLILAFTSLFANLLGFLPMQMGGREGGFTLSTTQLGMTPAIGLFISIISRVRELTWICIGLLLIKIPDPNPDITSETIPAYNEKANE